MTAMINGVPDLKNVIIGYKTIPVRGMCSYDAKDAISTARFRLVNEVTVFGITEFYAESMWLFGRTFNWPRHLMLAPINVRTEHFCLSSVRRRDCGKFHFHVSDLKPETVEAVREEEVCDRALYQTAKAVFKARIQAAPPDAQSDLRDFVSNFS